MKKNLLAGVKIRQDYIDFFVERGHTYVPSSSLVPGGDQTLLFTNAGMVQFKDVFLGVDKRGYTRACNSQKCMRVAGKHNDLEDVGRDDTHHTFFEMLGNWSFGDYYKKEAIAWAWELLTVVWGLPKENLWATCFRDDQGDIPEDAEAAEYWSAQPGMVSSHVLYFGRKENFWEMAETGPCGPCSEIHIDRGAQYCDKQHVSEHLCEVNGDCKRFLELWNLVFIQYNRLDPTHLEPLPAKHVDTGMGFERIVSVLQDVDSNYKTDLFRPMLATVQKMTGQNDAQRTENLTPYRVIADHARAAAFLIADGVVPGNTGRNYVCRMIIRRAARFGGKIGLAEPFLAKVAEVVIENYGTFYPELVKNRSAILDALTREEIRFHRTLEGGLTRLDDLLGKISAKGKHILPGVQAFELYATYGLPLEITRDIAREQEMDVDDQGFHRAMDEHRIASGAGETFGELGGEDVDIYRPLFEKLREQGRLEPEGVHYDPYSSLEVEGLVLALVKGNPVDTVQRGDHVEVLLPETHFYVEAGGQVTDTGSIVSAGGGDWEIRIDEMHKPAAGLIVHVGEVVHGQPKVGDRAIARVDANRRHDIMRNHTATHLLHYALRKVLGDHARQAGSLVAPDRLRFDFTHPEAMTREQLERVESMVNHAILQNYDLHIVVKPLQQAIQEGATALFGEKYEDSVRNITIGEPQVFSNELCGGTHVEETGDICLFLITSEGSVAAGVRRIEAVTGGAAYNLVQSRFKTLHQLSHLLATTPDNIEEKTDNLLTELGQSRKQIAALRQSQADSEFKNLLDRTQQVAGVTLLTAKLDDIDPETMRGLVDQFRQDNPQNGVIVLASGTYTNPVLVAAITDDLVSRGLHAGDLVKFVAKPLGGSGGGKPTLAQAGGKDASKLQEALNSVEGWLKEKLG